ncbi:hypothetical protein PCANC_26364 [Puccinia coronata f. sp. avenae]|uniref:Uncharacterized protein n=1 Tax=Puccinia coronata f. sp. avenae TaxID=200324 RepID=A0A2N5TQ35_9BASI|nr:hypothetical protein PCANC_26364 [Puccinia coronata f. sp. avenae]
MLQDGGSFCIRRLDKEGPPSKQNNKITFSAAECQTFQKYQDIDICINVFWRPRISQRHPIKNQGLIKAREVVEKSKSVPQLYFVVPANVYWTYKPQL